MKGSKMKNEHKCTGNCNNCTEGGCGGKCEGNGKENTVINVQSGATLVYNDDALCDAIAALNKLEGVSDAMFRQIVCRLVTK